MENNINSNLADVNKSLSYKSTFAFPFIKWFFTFLVALLPILFTLLSSLVNSNFTFHTLWEISGELCIVSIVTVTEPLWDLFNLDNKNVISVGLLVFKIIFIVFCVFIFSLTLTSDDRSIANNYEAIIEKTTKNIHEILKNNTIDSQTNNLLLSNAIIIEEKKLNKIEINETTHKKIVLLSFFTFAIAIFTGFLALRHIRSRAG